MRSQRFHGRYDSEGRACEAPDCPEEGEFRAPSYQAHGFDGPGEWRYFCLDHVRAFNDGFNFFAGMDPDEILAAQTPTAGWQTESLAFTPTAGIDGIPRWSDFSDPLDAIGARANKIKEAAARANARASNARANAGRAPEFQRFASDEREALTVMGLAPDVERAQLRSRYSELVRRYHPDRNGGDRSFEDKLQGVVEAYQLLRKSSAFG